MKYLTPFVSLAAFMSRPVACSLIWSWYFVPLGLPALSWAWFFGPMSLYYIARPARVQYTSDGEVLNAKESTKLLVAVAALIAVWVLVGIAWAAA